MIEDKNKSDIIYSWMKIKNYISQEILCSHSNDEWLVDNHHTRRNPRSTYHFLSYPSSRMHPTHIAGLHPGCSSNTANQQVGTRARLSHPCLSRHTLTLLHTLWAPPRSTATTRSYLLQHILPAHYPFPSTSSPLLVPLSQPLSLGPLTYINHATN